MRVALSVVCFVGLFLAHPVAHSQGETAVPFLLLSPSPDANGWGGVSTAVVMENATATISNPAQLGIFSLEKYFTATTYTPKTSWLPGFGASDLTFNVSAISAGLNLEKHLDLPIPVSVGVGYSRIYLNLGDFIVTGSGGPEELGRFHAYEKSENVSFGLGIDYFVKFGVGVSTKRIMSSLSPISTTGTPSSEAAAKASATDYGLLMQAPVFDIISRVSGKQYELFEDSPPLFDVTLGYSRTNFGDPIVYNSSAPADPLPRNATIGLGVELGLSRIVDGYRWKLLSLTLAREAEDLLIVRKLDGSFDYESGLGNISFFKHVVRGDLDDNEKVKLHKGWQLNFGEFVHVRSGSFTESPYYGNRNYSTSGFGIRSGGLLKLIGALDASVLSGAVFAFFANHVDLMYDHAAYSTSGPLGGTTFNSLTLVMK